jgi:dUTP pyrophosphatase
MINMSEKEYTRHDGERVCQRMIVSHERIEWILADKIYETASGRGRFGHIRIKK